MNSFKSIILLTIIFNLLGCSRTDEDLDVLSQEDISNIILHVKEDETGILITYNYTLNAATNPIIKLTDGKTYTVNAVFLNGNEDETESIKAAKDEHFILYDFHGSNVNLNRIDDETSTRSDGNKLGIKTRWEVEKAQTGNSPEVILTLVHDAISVSEEKNGTTFGRVVGGETDAMATFGITN